MNTTGIQTLADARASCPHLTDSEWSAILGLSEVIGEGQVLLLLANNGPAEHQRIAFNFLMKENASLKDREKRGALGAQHQRPKPLKLHVPLYKGGDSQNLPRWFVSVERAISAQQITDESLKVSFVISKLEGPARNWAEGCQLADEDVFKTYEVLKDRLMETFQPPKSEFRARAEFLDIRQDKLDIHAYVQVARDLISCIVLEPMDEATKVTTFMKGLKDGPVRTQLFRVYPDTLEEAISLAIQEDFSLKQAKGSRTKLPDMPSNSKKNLNSGPSPMELCTAQTEASGRLRSSGGIRRSKKDMTCYRCQRRGHAAYECKAAAPVPREGTAQPKN
jgi:hypothetical protein